MYRRDTLLFVATGMLGIGGCVGTRQPEVGLGEVRVQNLRDNPIEFRVSVDRAGEALFGEVFKLDGQTGQMVDGMSIAEEWMGERVEYVVAVELVNEGLERTFSTRDAEEFIDDWGSHECFGCLFLIENQMIDHALNPLKKCP